MRMKAWSGTSRDHVLTDDCALYAEALMATYSHSNYHYNNYNYNYYYNYYNYTY